MSYFDYAAGSRPQVEEWFQRVRDTGQVDTRYGFKLVLKQGGQEKTSYWDTSVAPLLDNDGKARGILLLTQDVTEGKRAEEAVRRSLEETARGQRLLLALSQAAQAVQRAHTPDDVYRTTCDEIRRLGYQATVFTVTDERTHLAAAHMTFVPDLLSAAQRLTGLSAHGYRFRLEPGGFYERLVRTGEPVLSDPGAGPIAEALPRPVRPLAGRLAALLGVRKAIYVPLQVDGETQSLLTVLGADLTEADVPAMETFARQAAIALENARLLQGERGARDQLRELAGYLQTAREEERTCIAREIHDEFGQALTVMKMDASWLSDRLRAGQPELAERADGISKVIDRTVQAVRKVATDLRPGLLDDLGLAAAIEWQTQEFTERTGIACDVQLEEGETPLDRDMATAVFRIFQETTTNVARHAQATRVIVELDVGPDELVLVVRDNGKGISGAQLAGNRSLGLLGMRERARALGGDITIKGAAGEGTTVRVRIPVPDREEGGV